MKIIKRITTTLGMIFLTSCQNYQVFCDISFKFDRCRCSCLNLDTLEISNPKECKDDWEKYFGVIPSEENTNFSIEFCENISGFFLDEIAKDIIPMIKEERRKCDDKLLNEI